MTMQRRVRYEDDDDFNIGTPRQSYENPTSAGMIGFIASMVSLGLLGTVVVLFIFLKQEDQGPGGQDIERTRLLYYWFLLIDVLSFCAALAATILGARGSSPTNPLYRGFGITALVLGIILMVITFLFGSIWMSCAILLVHMG